MDGVVIYQAIMDMGLFLRHTSSPSSSIIITSSHLIDLLPSCYRLVASFLGRIPHWDSTSLLLSRNLRLLSRNHPEEEMRRLVEIPQLDNRDRTFRANEPRQPSWFYHLPPYVQEVDLKDEIIVVSNPSNRPLDLTGYYLMDKGDLHRFEFEDGYILPAQSEVHVYCAPGKHGVDERDPPEHYVLWTNADGKPRKKSVLNPAGERITLMDNNSIEIAALEVSVGDDDEETRRYHLYRLEMLQRGYASMVVTSSQGARLIFLIVAFFLLLINVSHLKSVVGLEFLAISCDLFARWIDSLRLRNSKQRILAIIADRVEIVMLLCSLLLGTREEDRATRLFLGLLLVEVLSSWIEILQETTTAPFYKTAGQGSGYRRKLEDFAQEHPWVIIMITAGNQLFLFLTLISLAYEGDAGGWLQSLLRFLPFITSNFVVDKSWALLELNVMLAAVYRFLLMWIGLLGIIEMAA